uniref:Uncharacterized protein n=1 Tax=Tolypothrix bouteillei VB521301 TaxID=1479485 RepID=A0A0C1QLZ4_9CYAN
MRRDRNPAPQEILGDFFIWKSLTHLTNPNPTSILFLFHKDDINLLTRAALPSVSTKILVSSVCQDYPTPLTF